MSEVYNVIFKILGIYSLMLAILGIFFDFLGALVCHRIKNNSTFAFYKYGNLIAMFSFVYWNLNYFDLAFEVIRFDVDQNTWFCRIGSFVQFTSLQASSWIHVSYSRRLLSAKEINF